MSKYAPVLKDPLAELLALAPLLGGIKGSSRDLAVRFLRSNPGFAGRNMPLEAAQALASAAARAGFEAMVVPETALTPPQQPLTAEKIEIKGEGFNARSAGAVHFIPFESITVFSAAAYDAQSLPDTVQALKPGLFAKLAALAGAGLPPRVTPPKDTFFRADIIGGAGPLRLQLKPEALDFSPLGGGLSPSSLENFRALLGQLSAPAFGAVKNNFLRVFLANQLLAPHKVASAQAADLELTRLLLLSAPAVG